MFAGLELLRGTPADGPRVLWVFTDGEELNSAFKGDVVSQAAQGVDNLSVLAIDCMPGPKIDDFLAKFASQYHGQAKKAGAAADLLALFQKAARRRAPLRRELRDPASASVAGCAPALASGSNHGLSGSRLISTSGPETGGQGEDQEYASRSGKT
jgi:hypothetical protein